MKYNTDTSAIEISLKELCAIAYRSGDIGGYTPNTPWNPQYSKADLYGKIQTDYLSNGCRYESAVPLENTTLYSGICYYVTGVADGIVKDDGIIFIDEIAAVRSFEFSQKPLVFHYALLKCLAYFYLSAHELSTISVRLTRYNIDNDKIKYYELTFSADELHLFYYSLLEKIRRWAELQVNHALKELPSMADVSFPYAQIRDAQYEMIKSCYSAIHYNKRLFASAPTGTGKTVASLYPALKSLGEGKIDKIFYLTAKASTRNEAYGAVSKLFSTGAMLRAVVISAKEQVCLCPKHDGQKSASKLCNPFDCEYARGYYDRIDNAIFDLLSKQHGYNRETILTVAKAHHICPYELSLDISQICDIIICDYNYIFDPCVYLRRYFGERANERPSCVFLIDEAHNLPSRLRNMYSVSLSRNDFEKVYAKIAKDDDELNPAFEQLINTMRSFKKLCRDNISKHEDGSESGYYISKSPYSNFGNALCKYTKQIQSWQKSNSEHPLINEIEKCCDNASKYLLVEEMFDSCFLTYIEHTDKNSKITLFCLDPSRICDRCLNRASSALLFSATLAPQDYFIDLLGGAKNAKAISLKSPFERDNLAVIISSDISTKYEDRGIKTYRKAASVIAAALSAKAGNYIAYFPSYEFMEAVHREFSRKYKNVDTNLQKRKMTNSQKEHFLEMLKADAGVLRVGFCVLGGSFSEGIDLPGTRLIGAIIFGVGMPGLSSERNILKDYYENKNECGYDYAYTFPGMNNILQAAGRVIRTESDRGVVILADKRYTEEKYKTLFPYYWNNIKTADNALDVANYCREFWNNPS